MTGEQRRFGPGDVVVGDYVWGVGAWMPHPVIRLSRQSVTVGIHRATGGWLTTQRLRWEDIRGVIPAAPDTPPDVAELLAAAASRVRHGFLDIERREALAALLMIAGSFTLPTPVTASVVHAVTILTRPPRDQAGA